MDLKNAVLLVLGVLFFLVATYATYEYILPNLKAHVSPKEIYIKSFEVGKDSENYLYEYEEDLDGYIIKTTLVKVGNIKAAYIESPLATREIYYLENDTVLCTSFENEEICSSVKNESVIQSYLKAVNMQFITNEKIEKDIRDYEYLIKQKAITFGHVSKKKIGDKECEEVSFKIDYNNLTLEDAVRFGITQNSPTKIHGEICYDEHAKEVYEKIFTYKYMGKERTTEFTHIFSDWNFSEEISVEKNLTEGAVELLFDANEKQNEFLACLELEGIEKDKCVYSMALSYDYEKLCKYAGERADICKMNFAIANSDLGKCSLIEGKTVKDDCYLEIAAKDKDPLICERMEDKTRVPKCVELATKKDEFAIISENKTISETIEPPENLENKTPN